MPATFMWSSINAGSHECGKRAAFRQVNFKNGNKYVSGKEGEVLVAGRKKLRQEIDDQTSWRSPFSRCSRYFLGPIPAQLKSRAQTQMFMLSQITCLEYSPICHEFLLPLVHGLLIYWTIWSTAWECLWWSQIGSPSSMASQEIFFLEKYIPKKC